MFIFILQLAVAPTSDQAALSGTSRRDDAPLLSLEAHLDDVVDEENLMSELGQAADQGNKATSSTPSGSYRGMKRNRQETSSPGPDTGSLRAIQLSMRTNTELLKKLVEKKPDSPREPFIRYVGETLRTLPEEDFKTMKKRITAMLNDGQAPQGISSGDDDMTPDSRPKFSHSAPAKLSSSGWDQQQQYWLEQQYNQQQQLDQQQQQQWGQHQSNQQQQFALPRPLQLQQPQTLPQPQQLQQPLPQTQTQDPMAPSSSTATATSTHTTAAARKSSEAVSDVLGSANDVLDTSLNFSLTSANTSITSLTSLVATLQTPPPLAASMPLTPSVAAAATLVVPREGESGDAEVQVLKEAAENM